MLGWLSLVLALGAMCVAMRCWAAVKLLSANDIAIKEALAQQNQSLELLTNLFQEMYKGMEAVCLDMDEFNKRIKANSRQIERLKEPAPTGPVIIPRQRDPI